MDGGPMPAVQVGAPLPQAVDSPPPPFQGPPEPEYNWIYKKLVTGQHDVLGALAYALYKAEKIAYIDSFLKTSGQHPSDTELKEFHRVSTLSTRLNAYRDQADALLNVFIDNMLAERLRLAQDAYEQEFIATQLAKLGTSVDGKLEASEKLMQAQVAQIQATLGASRGVGRWFADAGANLLVNLITVVVIGLAVVGMSFLDKYSSSAKDAITEASGSVVTPALQPPTTPAK